MCISLVHVHCTCTCITQYGSTVYMYRNCHGWSTIIAIHKDITFSFNLNLSSKYVKGGEHAKKVTTYMYMWMKCHMRYEIQVYLYKHDFHRFFFICFMKKRNSITVAVRDLNFCIRTGFLPIYIVYSHIILLTLYFLMIICPDNTL